MKKFLRNIVFSVLLAFFVTACSTVPYTGRTRLLMTNRQYENNVGLNAWNQISSQNRISGNPQYKAALERVGWNIAQALKNSKAAKDADYNWEFKVFESNTANAFCLPGGKVAVYSALFKVTDNDAELASIVGHEIGHAVARHGGERMSHGFIQALGAVAVALSTKDEKERQKNLAAYGVITQVGAILPYSRLHEYEADYLGLIFMAQAGYDPRAAIELWKKFGKLSKTNEFTEFLSTHPMSSKRMDEMRKKMPEAMDYYNSAPIRRGTGWRYR